MTNSKVETDIRGRLLGIPRPDLRGLCGISFRVLSQMQGPHPHGKGRSLLYGRIVLETTESHHRHVEDFYSIWDQIQKGSLVLIEEENETPVPDRTSSQLMTLKAIRKEILAAERGL